MQDGEIKNKLSPAQVSVMRHRVTEPPYFGKYWDTYEDGIYRCAACDTPLFNSDEKFDSKSGWPSFKKPVNERDLQFKSEPGPEDKVEVRCKKCKSHLGYVIPNDPPYYRINSVCLNFEKRVSPPAAAPAAGVVVEPKKTEQTSIPEPATVTSSWSAVSLVTGIAIGFVAGAGLFWLLLSHPLPDNTSTATTTTEIATSTATSTPATTTKPKPKTQPSSSTQTRTETPQNATETATSTQ